MTVSVIFYFTEEFEAITPDIKGHVEGLIDNTNIAFLRSGIPVRLAMHCMLKAEIREAPDSTDRIREFKESQGTKTHVFDLYYVGTHHCVKLDISVILLAMVPIKEEITVVGKYNYSVTDDLSQRHKSKI